MDSYNLQIQRPRYDFMAIQGTVVFTLVTACCSDGSGGDGGGSSGSGGSGGGGPLGTAPHTIDGLALHPG